MEPGGLTFFADENVSHRAAKLLQAFDSSNEIRAFDDHFAKGCPDIKWMESVSHWSPKPAIIGGDGRILRNRAEATVLKACDLMFVYLAPGWVHLSWNDFAWKIVKAWPAIVRNVDLARRPTLFEVSASTLKVEGRGAIVDLRSR